MQGVSEKTMREIMLEIQEIIQNFIFIIILVFNIMVISNYISNYKSGEHMSINATKPQRSLCAGCLQSRRKHLRKFTER